MTEDVLEQVTDYWLRRRGYFTKTNIRLGAPPGDEGFVAKVHNQQSDLDGVAVNPTKSGPDEVLSVSGTHTPHVGANLAGIETGVWTFADTWADLTAHVTQQVEPSHVARLAQLLKAPELDKLES